MSSEEKQSNKRIYIENINVYEYLEKSVEINENVNWLDYYEYKMNINEFINEIDKCSKALYYNGVRQNDIVTIILPTTLEGIISFFATNKIGAVANFIHPSSSENEILDSVKETNSKVIIALDTIFDKINNITKQLNVFKIVLVNKKEYVETNFELLKDITNTYVYWQEYINNRNCNNIKNYQVVGRKEDAALILHSGGTTGTPKGVLLSNKNVIAFIKSTKIEQEYLEKGDTCLALMPIFHGFGLVHSIIFPLCLGMNVVLRDKFYAKESMDIILKYKPQILMGVPSLFDKLINEWDNTKINLDFLKCVLTGGDDLKSELRKKINDFLRRNNAKIKVCVAYGLTECVCAIMMGNPISPSNQYIGKPLLGSKVKIFDDLRELPFGEIGEICISGPTVMMKYYNNVVETKKTLRVHKDRKKWLHTGDLGCIDENGNVKYIGRLKRIIISSGYNIYPKRIEELLEKHDAISACIVVGKNDKNKIEIPKAFLILKEGYEKNTKIINELKEICTKNLPKYSWPCEYEFIDKIPVTDVGKVDYDKLKRTR